MSQFINKKETLVTEAIDGFLRQSADQGLMRLDGYPHIKVVYRDHKKDKKVAIISGGGSGHEPAHVGFVGKGMLAAAVCGEIFASPSVDAVLSAILAVTGKAGCLVTFKNYTGDRLNFGLAAEKARALGKKVEVVIAADDIALPDIAQPRGVAGAVFIHKIAGYVAESGASLAVVAETARQVTKATVSLGVALSSCTIPGGHREDRIPPGKAELGLGIHGEPGVELIDFTGAKQVATLLMTKLFAKVGKAKSYALLLNNLGGATALEMNVIAEEILRGPFGKKLKLIIGPASMVTSLDMHGLSASLLPLSPTWEKALLAPVESPYWPKARPIGKVKATKLPAALKATKVRATRHAGHEALIHKICDILISNEARLNALDAKVGDGDTGSTFATEARSIKAHAAQMPLADVATMLSYVGQKLSSSMGGSSGILLAIMFSAAGTAVKGGAGWIEGLQTGLARMKQYGGANLGDRTMIDALEPALKELAAGASLEKVAATARKGAQATAKMTRAKAGRSSYVSAANLDGVVDPGAEAVASLFEGLSAE
ncbi:MAG: dihydroxyacetone kinase subunit DhaK [Aestuariivirga sp.]